MKPLLLIAILALTGCERPLSGKIADKRYHPAHTTFTYINVDDVLIPMPQFHAARWTITIQGQISDGKTRQRVFEVGEQTYNEYKLGENYPPTEAKD